MSPELSPEDIVETQLASQERYAHYFAEEVAEWINRLSTHDLPYSLSDEQTKAIITLKPIIERFNQATQAQNRKTMLLICEHLKDLIVHLVQEERVLDSRSGPADALHNYVNGKIFPETEDACHSCKERLKVVRTVGGEVCICCYFAETQ